MKAKFLYHFDYHLSTQFSNIVDKYGDIKNNNALKGDIL
jgi:hypothetical protein